MQLVNITKNCYNITTNENVVERKKRLRKREKKEENNKRNQKNIVILAKIEEKIC